MASRINQIDSLQRLNDVFSASHSAPMLLFKHSSACGVSAHIYEMISAINTEIHVVVVQAHRDVSNEVEALTGYRHHSPQVFVIKDGRPIYHATHYAIDPAAIESLLNG